MKSILVAGFTTLFVVVVGCSTQQQTTELDRLGQSKPAESQVVESKEDFRLVQQESGDVVYPKTKLESAKKFRDRDAAAGMDAPVVSIEPSISKQAATFTQIRVPTEQLDRENYAHYDDNPVKLVATHPVSTFSVDVDTGSYANVRRILSGGQLPRKDAVRVEELINYFDYDYDLPDNKQNPFSIHTELATAPWNRDRVLMHVGIQGYDIKKEQIPASNLVFLIDVSGSMRAPNKLGLLKNAMKLMSRQLRATDRVSMVVYAGASGVVLEPTAGNATATIHQAIDALYAGGSTNGAAGIRLAYSMARQQFIEHGVNRIVLATDGDFNVGTVNFDALKDLVARERESGVTLTTLGFGAGNYNDHLMEQLADAGNGNYGYIDTLNEAQKVLVDELGATLFTIAKDVKIQIEFNPNRVAEYRLIGYENRMLKREDFNNDKIDAGDIGAGHSVTALYELTLNDAVTRSVDALRYGSAEPADSVDSDELAFLKVRYKPLQSETSRLIRKPIIESEIQATLTTTTNNYRFAAAVAAFGQIMRGGDYTQQFDYPDIIDLAMGARGNDPYGYRGEFLGLVRLAGSLSGRPVAVQ